MGRLHFVSALPEKIGIGSDFGETGGLASWVSFIAATIPSPTTRVSKLRGDFLGSEGLFGDLGEEERKRDMRCSWGFDMGVDCFDLRLVGRSQFVWIVIGLESRVLF